LDAELLPGSDLAWIVATMFGIGLGFSVAAGIWICLDTELLLLFQLGLNTELERSFGFGLTSELQPGSRLGTAIGWEPGS